MLFLNPPHFFFNKNVFEISMGGVESCSQDHRFAHGSSPPAEPFSASSGCDTLEQASCGFLPHFARLELNLSMLPEES